MTARASEVRDDFVTLIAIGLLAYASADIAHHVFGHGGACLLSGGRIVSLSSIFVNCTVKGAAVDLAGPCANLAIGVAALLIAFPSSGRRRLFLALAAGFNLLWFAGQLVFSAATRTDDWAVAMHAVQVTAAERYGMIAIGAVLYLGSVRLVAPLLTPFATPETRIRKIVWIAWLSGGILACVTALFDPHPIPALLHSAAPQSFILAIGLLFQPGRAARLSSTPARAIRFSAGWITAAVVVAAASFYYLGPGFAV